MQGNFHCQGNIPDPWAKVMIDVDVAEIYFVSTNTLIRADQVILHKRGSAMKEKSKNLN